MEKKPNQILPEEITSKILSAEDLSPILTPEFRKKHRIVFTNGCFDLLHTGHIHLLTQARKQGTLLIVGLNTDSSVKDLKGEGRPIQDEFSRSVLLASFWFVDYVILFSEPTPLQLILKIRPDILVKGGDYVPNEIVGYPEVTAYGGKVISIPFLPGYSTTRIIRKIQQ